jgi:hypothetical protein
MFFIVYNVHHNKVNTNDSCERGGTQRGMLAFIIIYSFMLFVSSVYLIAERDNFDRGFFRSTDARLFRLLIGCVFWYFPTWIIQFQFAFSCGFDGLMKYNVVYRSVFALGGFMGCCAVTCMGFFGN